MLVWADRYRRWVMAAIVVVYLAGFNAQWRLEPDSALYLSVGQNLADGHGYTFQGKPHRMAYPGLPILFAATFKATSAVLHRRSLVPALVIMMLIGMCTLGLTYRLFLLSAGRPTAVIVTAGVAMSRVFYRYNFELLSDLPFLLGVMSFLVGYEAVCYRRRDDGDGRAGTSGEGPGGRRRWFDWVLLTAGLAVAVAMRPAMWALVFAVIATAGWSLLRGMKRGIRWGPLLISIAVVGAVALFYLRDPRHVDRWAGPVASQPGGRGYGEEDDLFNLKVDHLVNMVRRAATHMPMLVDAVTKAAFGLQMPKGTEWAFGGVMIALGVLLLFHRPLWGMLIVMTVLMVLLVKPLDRYFLPVAPLLVFAWWRLCLWINQRLPGRWGNLVFAFLFVLGAFTNGAKVFGFMREQRQSPFLMSYKDGRFASINAASKMVAAHTPPSELATSSRTSWVLVGPKLARIMTFLSGRYAIEPEDWQKLDPDRQPLFALEPFGSLDTVVRDTRDPAAQSSEVRLPGVEKWLADRHLQCSPVPLAAVPNKDPRKKEAWSLYAVIHEPPAAPTPTTKP